MKTNLIHRLSSIIRPLARKACGTRVLRLHPKFRWLSYACPILQKRHVAPKLREGGSALRAPSSALTPPPDGPPKLRLRKRRRLAVRQSSFANRQS